MLESEGNPFYAMPSSLASRRLASQSLRIECNSPVKGPSRPLVAGGDDGIDGEPLSPLSPGVRQNEDPVSPLSPGVRPNLKQLPLPMFSISSAEPTNDVKGNCDNVINPKRESQRERGPTIMDFQSALTVPVSEDTSTPSPLHLADVNISSKAFRCSQDTDDSGKNVSSQNSEAASPKFCSKSSCGNASSEDGFIGFTETEKPKKIRKNSRTSIASLGSLRRMMPKWRNRTLPKQLCAVVRHGERADTVFETNGWSQTDDFKKHPNDPPLTRAGKNQARTVGCTLKRMANGVNGSLFHIVVSSPYLRCLQTAIEICHELGPHVSLLIDYEIGEIYGPDTMGNEDPGSSSRRSWESLADYCAQQGVKVRGRPVGQWPTWPETLRSARERFAKRYLRYLHRSLKAKRNFVLVTHADAVATALTLMPSSKDKFIEKVDFCGYFFGCRQIEDEEGSTPRTPATPNKTAETFAEDGKQLEDAKVGHGWSLNKEGIKVAKTRGEQRRSSLKLLGDTSNYSWTQIEQLLGELSSEVISNDQLQAVHHNSVSQTEKQEHKKKMLTFSRASLSTFLFGGYEE